MNVTVRTQDSFEATKQQIQRGGKLLYNAGRLGRLLLLLITIAHIPLLIGLFLNEGFARRFYKIYESSLFFRVFAHVAIIRQMPMEYGAAIGCVLSLLTCIVLLLFANMMVNMLQRLAAGEKPFNLEGARQVRRYSYLLLVTTLYLLPLGLIAFFLTYFFSFIMEYGSYIQERADETNRIQEEMIVSFAEITENKSGQTGKHIRRVSEYSRLLADALGLDAERCEQIRIASTMHDIGKLLIPSEILEKPGRLTDEEYAIIKKHTTYGGQLLENVEGEEMKLSRTIALQHHERYDGRGYPAGLHDDQISLEGRIVAVADVYDALTSRRSYKEAWEEDRAYSEIVSGSGTQFDPGVVAAFERVYDQVLAVRKKYVD